MDCALQVKQHVQVSLFRSSPSLLSGRTEKKECAGVEAKKKKSLICNPSYTRDWGEIRFCFYFHFSLIPWLSNWLSISYSKVSICSSVTDLFLTWSLVIQFFGGGSFLILHETFFFSVKISNFNRAKPRPDIIEEEKMYAYPSHITSEVGFR